MNVPGAQSVGITEPTGQKVPTGQMMQNSSPSGGGGDSDSGANSGGDSGGDGGGGDENEEQKQRRIASIYDALQLKEVRPLPVWKHMPLLW